MPKLSEEEFFRQYAAQSQTTVEELQEHGCGVGPCDCGDAVCGGWQMVSRWEYIQLRKESIHAEDA